MINRFNNNTSLRRHTKAKQVGMNRLIDALIATMKGNKKLVIFLRKGFDKHTLN
jgi:hypothetical protein